MALLLVGLSMGAYLHAIYGSTLGLAMLSICTASLIVAVGFVALTSPLLDFTGDSISAVALDMVPTALPVIAVVLAAVSAVAAIMPPRPEALAESFAWLRRLDRILHLHSLV